MRLLLRALSAAWCVWLGSGLMWGALAQAQSTSTSGSSTATPAESESSPSLAKIVVTAQKRSENIQDVPIAVSAFSAETLQGHGISDLSQIAVLTPSLQLTNTSAFGSGPSMLSAFIRGIGQDDVAANFDPGVGVYMDGVYLGRLVGANMNLLDISRVEVLKGPQGTLFGRNTIGGAISVVTRTPSDTFGIQGTATAGNFNRTELGVIVDLPLIKANLLASVAVSSNSYDGYQRRIPFPGVTNFVNDDPTQYHEDGVQANPRMGGNAEQSARVKLVWKVNDILTATLSGDYTHDNGDAIPSTLLKTSSTSPTGPGGLTLAGLYNVCINTPAAVLNSIGLGAACGPRVTVGTALAGVNVDGDPNNNRLTYNNQFVTGNQACPNVFRAESAVCRLELILRPSEYAKALYPAGFSQTG
jgi:iron complex outermembrane receptor protein